MGLCKFNFKYFFIFGLTLYCHAAVCQVKSGPVARYLFNDATARDETGNNNARTYGISMADDRFGNPNSACYFQGNKDSYLNLGTSSVLKPKNGTISIWVKMDAITFRGFGIMSNPFICTRAHKYDDFNEAYAMNYNFDVRKMSGCNSYSESDQVSLTSLNTAYMGLWYHMVLTYDNSYSCFYVNGVLQAKTAKSFESRFLEGDSVIAGCIYTNRNRRFFQGSIDDIEVYNRVLSPGEIVQLYKAPDPNKNKSLLRWVLTGLGSVVLLIIIVWLIKQRISKIINAENEKNRLNARLIELETRAIRTQMNPHFIFNALNTLQRFILEDKKEKSYTYLIEFSRLLRKLLESSESDTISLKEEIEILTAYLEIEKLRFDQSFGYKIIANIAQTDQVYIPFMLVQPFAENAIWHGLLNKDGLRLLTITFTEVDEKRILCEVDDNGVGRNFKTKAADPIKKKSLALDFIRQRLELLEQATGIACSLEIVDKKDAAQNSLGTTVRIIIPKSN